MSSALKDRTTTFVKAMRLSPPRYDPYLELPSSVPPLLQVQVISRNSHDIQKMFIRKNECVL